MSNRPKSKEKNRKSAGQFSAEDEALLQLKKQQELIHIKTSFKNWASQSVEEMLGESNMRILKTYDLDPHSVLVRVYDYRPTNKQEDSFKYKETSDGNKLEQFNHRYFPIIRVIKVGAKSRFKVGDFAKLGDLTAITIDNPEYEIWRKGGGNTSNMKKLGQEPPKLMSNLRSNYSKNIFVINPITMRLDNDDLTTLNIFDSVIQTSINDIESYINAVCA